jgi:hypothetical protein
LAGLYDFLSICISEGKNSLSPTPPLKWEGLNSRIIAIPLPPRGRACPGMRSIVGGEKGGEVYGKPMQLRLLKVSFLRLAFPYHKYFYKLLFYFCNNPTLILNERKKNCLFIPAACSLLLQELIK